MGLFSSSKSTSTPMFSKERKPHVKALFRGAGELYKDGPMEYYDGQQVASSNPSINQALGGAQGLAQGGLDASAMMGGYGSKLAQGLPQSQNYYSDAMNNYFNPYASAEFQKNFQTTNPYSSQDYNQIMADSVNNNPMLNQQIQQGQQGINRNLNENIMPMIGSNSVSTGNVSSGRRGVAEGIAMRGAMEQGSDMATNLRANAYNQGISQANNYAAGEQFRQGNAMTGAEMGARGTQYGQQMGMNAANAQAGLGQYGLGQVGAGYDQGAQAYQNLLASGAYGRGMEQEGIDANMNKFNFEQQAPWDNLARYQSAIGGDYGTKSVNKGAGIGGQLLGSALQAGAAYMTGGASLAAGAVGGVSASQPLNMGNMSFSGYKF